MSEKPSIDGLPFEIDGVEEGADSLELTYRNETGNRVTRRRYRHAGETVHETDEEWAYNFRKGAWECVRDFTREYDLATDQETLVGDNSGWDGAGRPWKEWFRQRHFERLRLRYRHDTIPDKLGAGSQQAAVA